LPFVLYGRETLSLTSREERKLQILGNKLARKISGPKSNEVSGQLLTLVNKEFRHSYRSPSAIIIVVKSRTWRWDVDGNGSGLRPVAGSGISGVETSGSATRKLVSQSLGK